MTPSGNTDDEDVERLLSSAQETMELGFAIDVVEREEDAGRWPDLTRLEARRPDILAGIIWFLARDVPVKSICAALKVSPCTVNSVRNHPKWKVAVVSESKGVVGQIEEILQLTVQHVLDEARSGKFPSAFDAKLWFEIMQVKTGGATARVEHVHSLEEEESLRFFQAARKAALPAPGMVFEAEILPQLGADSVRGGSGVDAAVQVNNPDQSGDCLAPESKS